ncbi:MAG: 50S ribosomal protein L35 [Lachnospiraceae bacterium]|nr:50S ribosomal protein L35 [Lachnospiraceae bacterium]
MPKLKTNRAAAKRFKKTGTGKFKRFKCGKAHILTKKDSKMKRRLRKPSTVDSALEKQTRRMLPYA